MLSLHRNKYSLYLDGNLARLRKRETHYWKSAWVNYVDAPMSEISSLIGHINGGMSQLDVWLGGSLCRWTAFPRPPRVYADTQLRLIADKYFSDRLGISAAAWRLSLWPQRREVLACAAQISLLDTIEADCKKQGICVGSIRPWLLPVMAILPRSLSQAGVLGLLEEDAVTFVDKRMGSIKITSLATNQQQKHQLLNRLALQSGFVGLFPYFRVSRESNAPRRKLTSNFCDMLDLERPQT